MTTEKDRAAKIAALNDALRTSPWAGNNTLVRTMLTRGVNAHGPEFVLRVLNAVAGFAAFTADNDPYGEHNFGSVEVDGHTIFWKIDYFQKDSDHSAGAEIPENAETTDRVLTVMLAEEY